MDDVVRKVAERDVPYSVLGPRPSRLLRVEDHQVVLQSLPRLWYVSHETSDHPKSGPHLVDLRRRLTVHQPVDMLQYCSVSARMVAAATKHDSQRFDDLTRNPHPPSFREPAGSALTTPQRPERSAAACSPTTPPPSGSLAPWLVAWRTRSAPRDRAPESR